MVSDFTGFHLHSFQLEEAEILVIVMDIVWKDMSQHTVKVLVASPVFKSVHIVTMCPFPGVTSLEKLGLQVFVLL